MNANILEKEENTSAKTPSSKASGLAVAALAAGAKVVGSIIKIKGVASFLSMLLSVLVYWWTAKLDWLVRSCLSPCSLFTKWDICWWLAARD